MPTVNGCLKPNVVIILCQCTFFEEFDENGDGNVDLDEFRTMIRASREVMLRSLTWRDMAVASDII